MWCVYTVYKLKEGDESELSGDVYCRIEYTREAIYWVSQCICVRLELCSLQTKKQLSPLVIK